MLVFTCEGTFDSDIVLGFLDTLHHGLTKGVVIAFGLRLYFVVYVKHEVSPTALDLFKLVAVN